MVDYQHGIRIQGIVSIARAKLACNLKFAAKFAAKFESDFAAKFATKLYPCRIFIPQLET
jgi:hypothetical protein